MLVIVLFFGCGQLYFNLKRIHNFPWYVFDMYSRPYNSDTTKDIVFLYINDTLFNQEKLPIRKEETIFNTAKLYNYLAQNKFKDPAIQTTNTIFKKMPETFRKYAVQQINNQISNPEEYKRWLVRYIEKNTHSVPDKIDFRFVHLKLEGNKYIYQYNRPFLIIK